MIDLVYLIAGLLLPIAFAGVRLALVIIEKKIDAVKDAK